MTKPNNLLIIDDHAGILWGLKAYLKRHFPTAQIATFNSETLALQHINNKKYDVYVTDIEMMEMGGIAFIQELRTIHKNAKIIIYSQHDGVWDVLNYKAAHVNGIVLKGPKLDPLKYAIEAVAKGETYYCEHFQEVSNPNNEQNADAHLLKDIDIQFGQTNMEIIRLIAEGKSQKDIAQETRYAVKSIPTKKSRIFKRFSVNTAVALVVKAILNGFPLKTDAKKKKGY